MKCKTKEEYLEQIENLVLEMNAYTDISGEITGLFISNINMAKKENIQNKS